MTFRVFDFWEVERERERCVYSGLYGNKGAQEVLYRCFLMMVFFVAGGSVFPCKGNKITRGPRAVQRYVFT